MRVLPAAAGGFPLDPAASRAHRSRKHGGSDDFDNLALACAECNLHKGSNLTGIDPQSNQITRLFDPRRDNWQEHFAWDGLRLVGLTDVGRTTARVLAMNSLARLRVRLAGEGR